MKRILSVLTVVLLAIGTADAQVARTASMFGDYSKKNKAKKGRKSTLLQRLTLGYGQHFVYNTVDINYRSSSVSDTTFSTGITSTSPMSGFLSFTFPLARISERSAFTLDVGATYTAFNLQYDTVKMSDGIVLTEQMPVSIISLPISFDFKTGGEATLDKANRLLFTGGIGIAPSYVMADNNPEASIKALPFVKLEAGFFLGLAFKLRGMAYIGNTNYIDDQGTKAVVPGIVSRKTSGGYGYSISLGIMPFSYKWKPVF
jgi:hypothetical protein